MAKATKFSPEVKERAVRLALEHQGEYCSQLEAVRSVAGKIGCKAETLRGCVGAETRPAFRTA